ncbi:MAG: hypothetical protein P1U50_00930 [Parvibaculaceae bacterium]|nr:hypothetical protein [Parvibaculaceae bacterium]
MSKMSELAMEPEAQLGPEDEAAYTLHWMAGALGGLSRSLIGREEITLIEEIETKLKRLKGVVH